MSIDLGDENNYQQEEKEPDTPPNLEALFGDGAVNENLVPDFFFFSCSVFSLAAALFSAFLIF